MVSYLELLLCTDMSDKYTSGPKEIASQSSCIFFSLCEFACYSNRQFKVPHWNHNCESINNVLPEGKCLDPQVLKMEVMPNLQLQEMWGHLVRCASIFKSWVLLSSPRDDSVLFTFLTQQWAPLCKGLCIPRKSMMGGQAQGTSYVCISIRSMAVCHWDQNKTTGR